MQALTFTGLIITTGAQASAFAASLASLSKLISLNISHGESKTDAPLPGFLAGMTQLR
jgi:hypothetical protein